MPYYRRNIYILSVTIFLASVSWNQLMPFLPLFLKQMGVSGSSLTYWVGIVFAAQCLAAMLAQPFWGKMGDSYGRKRMIIRAGICLAGIYFGMSICQTPLQLALLRFLNGALTGFIPGSFALIATNTPEELAPRSVATAQAASSAGLIAGPALGGIFAAAVGYRGSMQISAAAVLISTIVVWLFVKEPNKPHPTEKTSLLQDFAISVRSPVQLSVMHAVFLIWIFGAAISPFLALHLTKLNSSGADWIVGMVFSLPAAAFLISAHTWTRLGEQWGFERSISIGLIGGAIGAFALALTGNVWIFAVIYFLTGLFLAAISPSTSAITCLRVDESFRGRAYGIQQSAGTLGGLIAPLIAAQFVAGFGIKSIFVMVGVSFLVGAPIFRMLVKRWPKDAFTEPGDVCIKSKNAV